MNEDDFYDHQEHTVPCPVCKQPVYEDAPQCSSCGNYLSDADFPTRSSNWGALVVGVLVVAWLLQYVFSLVIHP